MTDERDTTMDAIKYLREVLRIHAADPAAWVDARTLALALAEFDATRARVTALEAALRDVCAAAEYVDPYESDLDMCELCGGCRIDGEFHHDDDCPVAAALALLEPGT